MLGRQPSHLAWLGNPGNAGSASKWADAKDAAARVGVVRVDVSRAEELEGAFRRVKGLDGLLVQWDFQFSVVSRQISQLAAQERVPAIYENRAQVLAGGLIVRRRFARKLSTGSSLC